MSSEYIFKKGDLVGVVEREYVYGYLITQVIRHNRFFYCYCIQTGSFHFLVFDPGYHFLLCPDFNPNIEPDIDILSLGVDLYDALDRLFGYMSDEDSDE